MHVVAWRMQPAVGTARDANLRRSPRYPAGRPALAALRAVQSVLAVVAAKICRACCVRCTTGLHASQATRDGAGGGIRGRDCQHVAVKLGVAMIGQRDTYKIQVGGEMWLTLGDSPGSEARQSVCAAAVDEADAIGVQILVSPEPGCRYPSQFYPEADIGERRLIPNRDLCEEHRPRHCKYCGRIFTLADVACRLGGHCCEDTVHI